eukprot:481567-Rhodomonas_salina.1
MMMLRGIALNLIRESWSPVIDFGRPSSFPVAGCPAIGPQRNDIRSEHEQCESNFSITCRSTAARITQPSYDKVLGIHSYSMRVAIRRYRRAQKPPLHSYPPPTRTQRMGLWHKPRLLKDWDDVEKSVGAALSSQELFFNVSAICLAAQDAIPGAHT